ncbi:hypothetical protein TWF569_008282 [Orbilia oligospora]|uniref:Histone H1 n=2 Tax=Orbilia oligospora TaxID=2813651 RepID=A0A7C8NAJ9_ORBOL|nr:hypothetical protein TWF103_004739 [Orbilia oligospora]KAF3088597.1 hypothetical protein TWF706_010633 [Orbilia oligospora]KAF3099239.1 hypothetical protein TWF102_005642 [Orbilia oligospora]KAF3140549.1 hypothetical protein TWF569_008282 [Orbilia oligospora]
MPPKKATGTTTATATATTTTTKKTSTPADHPSYKDMIKDAILQLKERNGSSRQALKKYVLSNNKGIKESNFDTQFNAAIKRGVAAGDFIQPKGPSGPVKLQKKDAAKSTTKAAKATGEKPAKKPTVKKASAAKKAAAAKSAAKPKAAAKPKTAAANSKKPRKTTAASTTEKPTTALAKTKAGRVSKTSKPAAPAKKAPAPKKAAPKKKAAEAAAPAAE